MPLCPALEHAEQLVGAECALEDGTDHWQQHARVHAGAGQPAWALAWAQAAAAAAELGGVAAAGIAAAAG